MARTKLTHRRIEIVVCGSGRFPFDMLRIDQCAPATQSAASCIGQDAASEFRIVNLAMYGHGNPSYTLWESFGWHVLTGMQLAAYQADPSIEAIAHLKTLLETTASL